MKLEILNSTDGKQNKNKRKQFEEYIKLKEINTLKQLTHGHMMKQNWLPKTEKKSENNFVRSRRGQKNCWLGKVTEDARKRGIPWKN
jgi:hypothetical protein